MSDLTSSVDSIRSQLQKITDLKTKISDLNKLVGEIPSKISQKEEEIKNLSAKADTTKAELDKHDKFLSAIEEMQGILDSTTKDTVFPWENARSLSDYPELTSLQPTFVQYRDALKELDSLDTTLTEKKDAFAKAKAAYLKAKDALDSYVKAQEQIEAAKRKKALADEAALQPQAVQANAQSNTQAEAQQDANKEDSNKSDSVNTGVGMNLFDAELATALAAVGLTITIKKRKKNQHE